MRTFNLSVAGVVAGVLLFGSSASILAQELFEAEPPGLQFEREVRSTYIVRLANELPAQAVNNRASEVAARFGGRIKYTYTNTINGFAITMPSVAMTRMLEAGGLDIVSVTRDRIVTIDASKAPSESGKPPGTPGNGGGGGDDGGDTTPSCDQRVPWGVADVTSIVGTGDDCFVTDRGISHPGGNAIFPDYSATGLSVCVLDTGVDIDHPDLNVDQSISYNFSTDKSDDDLNGHGSHVAGTIGAIGDNGFGVVGVAPNANIISVKVLNRRGSGSYSGVIAGVDKMADMTDRTNPICAVANMSLGGPSDSVMIKAVKCASARDEAEAISFECSGTVQNNPAGITFTLAAGNSGKNSEDYSPANASTGDSDNIHTVAAMDSGWKWAYFSNYGQPIVDYIEPGYYVESTYKDGKYKTYSGTSMAAPHMAGLVLRNLVNSTDAITLTATSFATGGATVTRTGTGGTSGTVADVYAVAVSN